MPLYGFTGARDVIQPLLPLSSPIADGVRLSLSLPRLKSFPLSLLHIDSKTFLKITTEVSVDSKEMKKIGEFKKRAEMQQKVVLISPTIDGS